MAAYDLEEQERIDALKDWWEKWGIWVYAGVAAFLIGMAGVYGWRHYESRQSADAEALFKTLEKAAQDAGASKDTKKLSEAAAALANKYPRTFYATDARLLAAKIAFDANDLAGARVHLQWVADNGRDTFKPLAHIRLAAVLLDEKKHDEALKSLDRVKDENYASLVADLRGDILGAQGKKEDARAAYQLAVDKAPERSPLKGISQAKLDAFGGSTAKPADTKDSKDSKGTKQ